MNTTYARLRYRASGRVKTALLMNPVWSDNRLGTMLSGRIVNREGEPAQDGSIHLMLASPADVVHLEPMEMDGFYGTLVPVGTAKIPVGRTVVPEEGR